MSSRRAKSTHPVTKGLIPIATIGLIAMALTAPAIATATSITNGDFETDSVGDTSFTGWTAMNQTIDLGVTQIAGCTTVDTSNYLTLRDWENEWQNEHGGNPNALVDEDPLVNNDSLPITWDTAPNFDTTIQDGNNIAGQDPDFVRNGNVIELFSEMNSESDFNGFVLHGPAIYSDPFTAKTIDDLTLDWAASDDGDDYHVFGYLLNTADCTQTEVIDSTGETSIWQTVDVAIPTNGTYRFVFVSGTFDQSFGGVAGAYLYLDNIALTVNEERAAEEAAAARGSATFEGPTPITYSQYSLPAGLSNEITLAGEKLNLLTGATINGKAVTIKPISPTKATLVLPALPVGTYDIVYTYSPGASFTHLAGLKVLGAGSSTNAGIPNFSVNKRFTNYRGDLGPVVAADRRAIEAFIKANPGLTNVTCVGSTSGVPAKSTDLALATARAENACQIVKDLVPGVTTRIATSVGKGSGQFFRAVTIFGRGVKTN